MLWQLLPNDVAHSAVENCRNDSAMEQVGMRIHSGAEGVEASHLARLAGHTVWWAVYR